MYSAKQSGRGHAIFEPELDRHSPRRLALAGGLRSAINEGQIQLYYQPKADLRTGRIMGAEALARWDHPEFGIVGPSEFVPIAEQTGLITPLTSFVLDAAIRQVRDWKDAGLELSVAVNLSARSFLDTQLAVEIPRLLAKLGRRGRAARARDHREHADDRPGPRRGDARAPEPDRPDALGRRLRHRLLVAGQPQAAAGRRDQDRQVVRDGDGRRRVRRGDRALHDRPRPQPRPDASSPRASSPRTPGGTSRRSAATSPRATTSSRPLPAEAATRMIRERGTGPRRRAAGAARRAAASRAKQRRRGSTHDLLQAIYRSCRVADIRGVLRASLPVLAVLTRLPATAVRRRQRRHARRADGARLHRHPGHGRARREGHVRLPRHAAARCVRVDLIAPGRPAMRVRLGRVGARGSVRGRLDGRRRGRQVHGAAGRHRRGRDALPARAAERRRADSRHADAGPGARR